MTESDRYRAAVELFDELVDLPAADRESMLARRCAADPDLEQKVRVLLEREDRISGDAPDAPADASGRVPADWEETGKPVPRGMRDGGESGERIGSYRLLQKVGEGGMGIVYEAEQIEPIRRRVALKLVKRGMASREVVARFEAERQAVAMMDHPAVAKVFDAGETEDGRTYFVMEFVPGVPITEHCDRNRLNIRERVELFIEVCAGVQHAHQKAIIHRDLKPSNVLVALQDGKAVPKIIDFGIAKAMSAKLTDQTLYTELGAMIGTPEYMSPEQAEGTGQGVDTRADVYSLGAMLYELLAGSLPFESNKLRAGGIAEIARVIREDTPPRPSTRVSKQGADLQNERPDRVDLAALSKQLRGDLDWIVMKALEKDPGRRYASPNEFAADLRRFLKDEPVLAGPPSATYRARKFYQRNRGSVTMGLAALAMLIVALIVTTALWSRAEKNRALAEDRFDQVSRLADLKRVRDYRQDADELWPAVPKKLDALKDWLEHKGRPLVSNLPIHKQTLEELRATADPYDAQQTARDRATHPLATELQDTREYVDYVVDRLKRIRAEYDQPDKQEILDHYEERLRESREKLPPLEEQVNERRTWQFDDEQTQWQHEMLTQLVDELTLFADPDPHVGALSSVEQRLVTVREIEEKSVSGLDAAARWQDAMAGIAASPVYGGLEIEPQLGLLPLGPDPRSGLWEFFVFGTGDRPTPFFPPRPDARFRIDGDTGMVLVLIPGGSFTMGAQATDPSGPNYDPLAGGRERPPMEVTLEPFFLSKYEVTQGQWRDWTGKNPNRYDAGGAWGDKINTWAHPVESVSWLQMTIEFGRLGLRLPTESQWEYAARGGTRTRWWTGDDPRTLQGAVNLSDRFAKTNRGRPMGEYEEWLDDGYTVHAPVDLYRPNGYGLHGMLGNVSEWCMDHFQSPLRKELRPGDGFRKIPGGTVTRVTRGGNFSELAPAARVTNRNNIRPNVLDFRIGGRAARPLIGDRFTLTEAEPPVDRGNDP